MNIDSNILQVIYNSPYYIHLNHKTYFKDVNVNTFLEKFNVNTNTCKHLNQTELKKQLKLLHFLIHISYPLINKSILMNNFIYKIDSIKLLCNRYNLPLHQGAMGDYPHFTLEIKAGAIPMNCHLYLNGLLTSNFNSLILSNSLSLQDFDQIVKELKNNTKLNASATVFKP